MTLQTNTPVSPEILRAVRIFAPLQESELALLIQSGEIIQKESHANIVIEGELSWGIFVILDGVVGILKNNSLSGEVYDVGQLGAGAFFGEMSLIDEQPRSATVRALLPVKLLHIPKDKFMAILNSNTSMRDRFYENCIHDLVKRLRELDENYVISQYQLWKTAMMGDPHSASVQSKKMNDLKENSGKVA
jgi:CRP/FNR family cyclic AMP-dependent transcriptional regulator